MSCSDCFKGHDRPGAITGVETHLHGVKSYVTQPTQDGVAPKGLIVVISDAFGWKTNNIRLLADSYARRTGCRVYVPDFMDGTAAPQWMKVHIDRIMNEAGIWGWIAKPFLIAQVSCALMLFRYRHDPSTKYPMIKTFMAEFRGHEGKETPVGVIGFCWGGYHATKLADGSVISNGQRIVDAVFAAHPSELHIPTDIKKIRVPYSMAVGDADFSLSLRDIEEIKAILENEEAVESEIVIIHGAKHGFAVRANPNDKGEMEMADEAENQAVAWFNRHL